MPFAPADMPIVCHPNRNMACRQTLVIHIFLYGAHVKNGMRLA